MNTRVVKIEEKVPFWNELAPHPLVSWEWGEARKKMGVVVERCALYEDDIPREVFQITFHHVPSTPYTIGYMPKTHIPSQHVTQYLRSLGNSKNSLFIKCEPNVHKNETVKIDKEWVPSKHPLFPTWTQQLDLRPSEEELLLNMKSKWRYNIRLAQKKGVVVKEMTTDEGFKIFADLYFATTERQKYKGHNRQYHQTIFNTLKDSMSHILIAFYEGKPLSAYHLFYFNNMLYYPYGGSSDEHRNVMASNVIMWEAIRLGKKLGASTFDMWGSLPPGDTNSTSAWAGFSRFKEGFGSQHIEFIGSHDLILKPMLYPLYNIAHRLRNALL